MRCVTPIYLPPPRATPSNFRHRRHSVIITPTGLSAPRQREIGTRQSEDILYAYPLKDMPFQFIIILQRVSGNLVTIISIGIKCYSRDKITIYDIRYDRT